MKYNSVDTEKEELLNEVITGLTSREKHLPSKLFYDERGSQLFEEICETKEYYLTRTEIKILTENINEISSRIGKNVLLIEFGAGSSIKTKLLLQQLKDPAGYIPIDISADYLVSSAENLRREFPHLPVYPVTADYTKDLELPEIWKTHNNKAVFFPGSTIGNFTPMEAKQFIKKAALLAGPGGALIIGIDLVKPIEVIEAAYNDSQGVTARFNLNILQHINSELGADFNLSGFRHYAFFNTGKSRVEMHLISTREQSVNIAGTVIHLKKDEGILTEYSYKYSLAMLNDLLRGIYKIDKFWADDNMYFGIFYLRPI